jgi:multidrug efflux pump subunit AcrA (membrane-fusion protein)
MVRIAIPADQQKGLYSGMYVNAFIPTESTKEAGTAVMVPKSSIIHRDQLTGIYTIGEGDVAILRWVRLGKESGDQVEVLSGLASNESFITSSEGKLYNGVPIKK